MAKANNYARLRELLDVVRQERDQAAGALIEYRQIDAARVAALQEVATMKQKRSEDSVWSYVAIAAMGIGVAASGGALGCSLAENCPTELVYGLALIGAAGSVGSLGLLWWRF